MLKARAALMAEFDRLHRMVLDVVRRDPLCRRLMSVPGVGALDGVLQWAADTYPCSE